MNTASVGNGIAASPSHRRPLIAAMNRFLGALATPGRGWTAHHTALACVLLAWLEPDSIVERFDAARALLGRALPRRRKLGRTYQGLAKAAQRHGEELVERTRAELRAQAAAHLRRHRLRFGVEAVAVDGSRFDAPRTLDNETHLGAAGRGGTHPQMMVTTVWHMGTGLPWDWRVGPARSSERAHLLGMLDALPPGCLVVLDAGFAGYDLLARILDSGRDVLIRAASNTSLLLDLDGRVRRRGEAVWLWPGRRRDRPPLRLRLIVVGKGKATAHLVTSVLDRRRLPHADAAGLYAMRWGVEVFYRHAKQTLGRRKVRSACARRAVMEMHWTLVGLSLLLLMAADRLAARGEDPLGVSVAAAWRVIKRVCRDPRGGLRALRRDLARCVKDERPRAASSKRAYRWPHKKREKPPGPPRVRAATHAEVRRAKEVRGCTGAG